MCLGTLPYQRPLTGIFSMSLRLIPMVIVDVEEGHEPHAPCRRSLTTRPSSSTNSTLPPSAIRYGRTSSSTWRMAHAWMQKVGHAHEGLKLLGWRCHRVGINTGMEHWRNIGDLFLSWALTFSTFSSVRSSKSLALATSATKMRAVQANQVQSRVTDHRGKEGAKMLPALTRRSAAKCVDANSQPRPINLHKALRRWPLLAMLGPCLGPTTPRTRASTRNRAHGTDRQLHDGDGGVWAAGLLTPTCG